MRRKRLLVLGGILGVLASFPAWAAVGRLPIHILGDGDFTAANGVVAGTGSREDPYVIAGWEIDVPQGVEYAVSIENITASFILRGLILRGATAIGGAAIRLGFVSGGVVEDCSISSSTNGIEIASSTGVTLERNVIVVSGRSLKVLGESAEEYRHTIDESNLVNDYPLRYLYGREGETVTGLRTGNLFVAASRSMTISDNEVVCGDGIQLAFVEDSLIVRNRVHRASNVPSEHGISLYRSDRNTIRENVLWNNRYAGIYLWVSSNNRVTGNEVDANDTGILLAASDRNEVSGNLCSLNPTGIGLSAGSTENVLSRNVIQSDKREAGSPLGEYRTKDGVILGDATRNRVEANAVVNAERGIALEVGAIDNTIHANTVVGSGYGFSVSGSNNEISGNLIATNSRGILFPETFGRATPAGNRIHDNALSENRNQIYLCKDSEQNLLYRNSILGGVTTTDPDGRLVAVGILDYGSNLWTVSDEGNYWEGYSGADADADGMGDASILIGPSGVLDASPFMLPPSGRSALGVLGTLEEETVTVRTDSGERVPFAALIAEEVHARFTGFRGFPASLLAGFPAVLFVFDRDLSARFTMESVPFALDIVFFAADGSYSGGTTMEARATTLYTSSAPFTYALELQEGTLAARGIGAGSTFSR